MNWPSYLLGVASPFVGLAVLLAFLWVFERTSSTSYGCQVCDYWTTTRWVRLKMWQWRLHGWRHHHRLLRAYRRAWDSLDDEYGDRWGARERAARNIAADEVPDEAPPSWRRPIAVPTLAPQWHGKPGESCAHCGTDPAPGYARIRDFRVCHPDDAHRDGASCYELVTVHGEVLGERRPIRL